jgi:amidohydrolase
MTSCWGKQLDAAVDERFEELVALRRHLHAHPEVSGEERETSLHLYQLLTDHGFEVRMGPDGRGIVVDSHSPWPDAGIIALRADLDALRIRDAKEVAYRSCHDGVMHACGHDGHTAVVFGALLALKQLQITGDLPCELRYRGIFQPAEETCEGAQEMIEVGALEGVSAILAVHMDPSRRLGTIGLRAGVLTANCDEMRITLSGHGGHAARPHETSDPIAAAAQLINALYLYIPRVTDSQDAVVITIGQITGGENANVIPEEVLLRGTIRSLDRSVRRQTMEHVTRLARGIAQMTDTSIEVHFGLSSDSVDNDPRLIDTFRQACYEVVGADGIQDIPKASMGSEDFAFYLQHVPGAMARLGCQSDSCGGSPLHTPTFDIDEQALQIGAKVMARAAVHRALDEPVEA